MDCTQLFDHRIAEIENFGIFCYTKSQEILGLSNNNGESNHGNYPKPHHCAVT